MRLKTQRRAIYVGMGLTVLALVGGFTLANLTLGGTTSSSYQGSHSTTVAAVPGLNWTGTDLNMDTAQVVNTTGCAATTGCDVSSSSAVVCAGSTHSGTWCAAGDFVEQVVFNTTYHKSMGGVANITMFVATTGASYEGETFYFHDTDTNYVENITLDFDIGNTSVQAPVSDVSVVVTV
jgi:hypothetical protein